MIFVTNLADMPGHARTLRPSHLISLVETAHQPPTPRQVHPERHLRVEIHDITEPMVDCVLPDAHHVSRLLDFVDGWSGEAPLLVHCMAGISRSTAAALIALSVKTAVREEDAARRLRRLAPHAQPNPRLIALADDLMGREGRLVAACAAIGPGLYPPVATFRGPLVELSLTAEPDVMEKPVMATVLSA